MSQTACQQLKKLGRLWAAVRRREQIKCQRVGGTPIPDCRPTEPHWAATFRDATVQKIAISGDRAAAMLSNRQAVQLQRIATGEWLIDTLGPNEAVDSTN
jgi:hypothetical protein